MFILKLIQIYTLLQIKACYLSTAQRQKNDNKQNNYRLIDTVHGADAHIVLSITLFLSLSLLRPSSFLWSLEDLSGLSAWLEDSPLFSFLRFSQRSLSFLPSSSRFLKVFSPSWRSLLLRRSSSCRLIRSFSFWRRSRSRSLSWSASRSL